MNTLSWCISDLELWVEGKMDSHTPSDRLMASETEECINLAKSACKFIRTTFHGDFSKITYQEKLAMRHCLLKSLHVFDGTDFHKNVEECLVVLRTE
jgi:hypothetical protein